MELDDEDDMHVADWLYDSQPLKYDSRYVAGSRYRRWRLPVSIMGNLFRLANQLLSDLTDPNYFYLFDLKSFFTVRCASLRRPLRVSSYRWCRPLPSAPPPGCSRLSCGEQRPLRCARVCPSVVWRTRRNGGNGAVMTTLYLHMSDHGPSRS